MEKSGLIERLLSFGLTRQEAQVYLALAGNGELTGYEAAKETGISRSNVYNSLAGLVDKGAAYVIEGTASRYMAVSIEEFCGNVLLRLREEEEYLKKYMPHQKATLEGYITIQGYRHILDKIHHMLALCKSRLYFAAPADFLEQFQPILSEMSKSGRKVVIITDDGYRLEGAVVYPMKIEKGQIRLITDSSYVLTGEAAGSNEDTCLYSGQKNLVKVFKEALRDRIRLIELENDGKIFCREEKRV